MAVPVFDRTIEIARAGARIVASYTRIVVAEGNYLLLDEPCWRDLGALFDVSIMVKVSEEELAARLTARWKRFDYAPEAIRAKLEENDLPNARVVIEKSRPADIIMCSDAIRL